MATKVIIKQFKNKAKKPVEPETLEVKAEAKTKSVEVKKDLVATEEKPKKKRSYKRRKTSKKDAEFKFWHLFYVNQWQFLLFISSMEHPLQPSQPPQWDPDFLSFLTLYIASPIISKTIAITIKSCIGSLLQDLGFLFGLNNKYKYTTKIPSAT